MYWRICFAVLSLPLFLFLHTSSGLAQQDTASLRSTISQTEDEATKSLKSFRKLDDHPLFEMRYFGDYVADKPLTVSSTAPTEKPAQWACSIFVSYGKDGQAIFGRNFDWQHNPALVLHTNPSNGYASVSLVDISYLGF